MKITLRSILSGFRFPQSGIHATANAAAEMQLGVAISTANIAEVADGGWAVIAPYGDHPAPDGSYVQRFDRGQAEKVVKTWNSLAGLGARIFKNAMHGRLAKSSLPVWDGHPETDRQRWPKDRLLAEITDIRAGAEGLEGQVTWNARGLEQRTRGPLYPSPLWWHWPPSGEPPAVYPELLESVGLVPTPNISSVPAWTQNARMGSGAGLADEVSDFMTEAQLMELRRALGLPENADAVTIISTANAAHASVANLQTANTAKADVENQLNARTGELATANGTITTLTGERDTLKTANATLTTERDGLKTANGVLAKGILDVAEKRGIIAPAERADFETRISTANTAAAALTELQTRKPKLNTEPVVINGNRVDITTANARQQAFDAAVAKRMKDDSCDRDVAFARCLADPNLAALTSAMQDPTKAAA